MIATMVLLCFVAAFLILIGQLVADTIKYKTYDLLPLVLLGAAMVLVILSTLFNTGN